MKFLRNGRHNFRCSGSPGLALGRYLAVTAVVLMLGWSGSARADVELKTQNVAITLDDSFVLVPVYLHDEVDTITGYDIWLYTSDPFIVRFDSLNPINAYNAALVGGWEYRAYSLPNPDGLILHAVGLYNLPTPIEVPDPVYPGPGDRWLFTVKMKMPSPSPDSLCGFLGTQSFGSFTNLSDIHAQPITVVGHDGKYVFRCWVCGNANGDARVNVSDAVHIVTFVFVPGSPAPTPYLSGDVNCDLKANVSDAVSIINFVFLPGSPPPCAACP